MQMSFNTKQWSLIVKYKTYVSQETISFWNMWFFLLLSNTRIFKKQPRNQEYLQKSLLIIMGLLLRLQQYNHQCHTVTFSPTFTFNEVMWTEFWLHIGSFLFVCFSFLLQTLEIETSLTFPVLTRASARQTVASQLANEAVRRLKASSLFVKNWRANTSMAADKIC